MRVAHFLLLAMTIFFAAGHGRCLAQGQCPWMNAATAAGFLGGEVQSAVTGVNVDGDATCEFTRADAMLRIAVHSMPHIAQDYKGYLAACGDSAVALKGIGNQAVRCIPGSGANKVEEVIVGRVRERVFIITIRAVWAAQPPTTATKTRNPISDDSENIAEQVAGSMF